MEGTGGNVICDWWRRWEDCGVKSQGICHGFGFRLARNCIGIWDWDWYWYWYYHMRAEREGEYNIYMEFWRGREGV